MKKYKKSNTRKKHYYIGKITVMNNEWYTHLFLEHGREKSHIMFAKGKFSK